MTETYEAGAPILSADGVSKRFGHVHALVDASIQIRAGEVLALVGDNGAGKSTLMKTITGVVQPDQGAVRLSGRTVQFRSALDARRQGVAVVFQDLALVECLDVATNMFLGEPLRRHILVNRRRMEREAIQFLQEIGVKVYSPRTPVGMLSGGQRQLVAIARALRLKSPILVMDEPTAALGVRETAQVGRIIDRLREEGRGIVLVSHDFPFVFEHSDRIQVMRLGRVVDVLDRRTTNQAEVIACMTGARTAA